MVSVSFGNSNIYIPYRLVSIMGFFRKNKQEPSNIMQELGIMSAKIVRLEAEIDGLTQKFNSLRGLVNKKLGNVEGTETNKYSDPFKIRGQDGVF